MLPIDPTARDASRRGFATTAWSRVLKAGSASDPGSRPALEELCASYWYPLYAFVRRRGSDPAEAEDHVQGFFTSLLESNAIQYADPARGRFRGFLVASFRQFLAKQHEHRTAAKRTPPGKLLAIDAAFGESRYSREPADDRTPEKLFEYSWALAVLDRAMTRLQAEQAAEGKRERFEAFRGSLTGQSGQSANELGESLGLSEGAVRVAIHRLRQRYGELLREEVAGTLESAEDVEAELKDLMAALQGGRRA